jgi:hypothetical protein
MREPFFSMESKRTWTNGLGVTNPAVSLQIYEKRQDLPFKQPAWVNFEANIGSPAGYTTLKSMADLCELRTFLDIAIKELTCPAQTKRLKAGTKK